MSAENRLPLSEIEHRVCDVTSEQLGLARQRVTAQLSFLEDLGCDSLDMVEVLLTVEETFSITLPADAPNPVYKAVFTRHPFRIADLAELVYLQQGTGTPARKGWRQAVVQPHAGPSYPFTQLGGHWNRDKNRGPLIEPLKTGGPYPLFRRLSDGMRCVRLPAASVEIGTNLASSPRDETPRHIVKVPSFMIDAEPVSTTAYCRFLNSIGTVYAEVLQDWFVLDNKDDRNEHMLIALTEGEWRPLPGTERFPMILVSWFGANAYSLWANSKDWQKYRAEPGFEPESFLPTEAQWEYAARGAHYRQFPWGDAPPSPETMRFGQHRRSITYRADTLPLADVNEELGMSPFGLHHMAGNVWQWCRDWYADDFYRQRESSSENPVNRTPTHVRSERGGSWIGPAEVCRSSFRRGRPPLARGRCLGFRCVM